jgi:hypothetical protein
MLGPGHFELGLTDADRQPKHSKSEATKNAKAQEIFSRCQAETLE